MLIHRNFYNLIFRIDLDTLPIEEISLICCQLDHALMPVFSGGSVDTRINKLDTNKLDIVIEKKKYDAAKREIVGIFVDTKLTRKNSKFGRQDSVKSNRGGRQKVV
jgi:hypothetical protein